MTEGKMRRMMERLEELDAKGENVEIVYRDGRKADSIFSRIYKEDGTYNLVFYSAIFMDEGSKLEDETYKVPAHEIGYLFFPKSNKKISMMSFQKPEKN